MLNNKQKQQLKSQANSLKFKYNLGKNNISPEFVKMIDDALEAKELIKISVLKNASAPISEIAFDIAAATRSEIVQVIGRVITLYRKSKKNTIVRF
ncbi:MAG: ribosome assembly RNA-binding protein YhbY [Bacilli bacterium]|jgi:RNA-binding protein